MAPRANWKGLLKVAEVACPVALYTAASTSDRLAFRTINRATGHRVQRRFVDSETGKPVDRDDQVKGYETGAGDHIVLEPEEIAAAIPDSDKTLNVEAFITCDEVDTLFIDRPYYLSPDGAAARETFALIRDGLKDRKVAALAQAVLFRRVRTLLIRPHGEGLLAATLNFDYEVRSAEEAFDDIRDRKIDKEMLALARHIIDTKTADFDPAKVEDRYEAALTDLVKAKAEGRRIAPRKEPRREKVVDLMEALRASAGKAEKKPAARSRKTKPKTAAPRRKAS